MVMRLAFYILSLLTETKNEKDSSTYSDLMFFTLDVFNLHIIVNSAVENLWLNISENYSRNHTFI